MSTWCKALACWAALVGLAVLNPVPTGGAMLIFAPLVIFTYCYTKEWFYERVEALS